MIPILIAGNMVRPRRDAIPPMISVQVRSHLTERLGELPSRVTRREVKQFTSLFKHQHSRGEITIVVDKSTKTILPQIAMMAYILQSYPGFKRVDLNLDIKAQSKQVDIPQEVLTTLRKGLRFKHFQINLLKMEGNAADRQYLFGILLTNNQCLRKLTVESSLDEATAQLLTTAKQCTLEELGINGCNLAHQSVYQSLRNLDFSKLLALSLKLVDTNTTQQNLLQTRNLCLLLPTLLELSSLQLQIPDIQCSQLCTAISKVSLLSKLCFLNQMSFTEVDLLLLLDENVFLCQLAIDYHQILNPACKDIYRLIRQRRRLIQMQLMSIKAIQNTFKDFPLQQHHVLDILESQRLYIV